MKPIKSAEAKPDKLNPEWAEGTESKPDQCTRGGRGGQGRQGKKARRQEVKKEGKPG